MYKLKPEIHKEIEENHFKEKEGPIEHRELGKNKSPKEITLFNGKKI